MRRFLVVVVVLGALAGVVVGLFVAPVAVSVVLGGGLGGDEPASAPSPSPASPSPPAGEAAAAGPSEEPSCVPGPVEARAAQVLVVGLPDVADPEDDLAREVTDLGVGGVFVSDGNVVSAAQVRDLADGLRERSPNGLLVATDEESGRVSSFRSLLGDTPSPRELAATSGPEEIEAYASGLGAQLAEFGVDLDFAPVADLAGGDPGAVIGDRSFSSDPATASVASLAFSRGLAAAGVLPAVKHFPGQGRAVQDSHVVLEVVEAELAELEATDLVPFDDHVAAGAPVVMTNHLAYTALDPELPASLAPQTYALLRDRGFTGVAITDSLGMGAVNTRWPYGEAAVMAVAAGADAVLATDGAGALEMRDALVGAVADGRLPEARLDEAVARVMTLKGVDPAALTCATADLPAGLAVPGAAGVPGGDGSEGPSPDLEGELRFDGAPPEEDAGDGEPASTEDESS